jgi:signal recognition particle subunit SEC65
MAYVFIDDGYPEADEYETNYVEFDASDPKKIRLIIQQVKKYLKQHKRDRHIHSNFLKPSFS